MNQISDKINYLDGIRLHRALVAGIYKVVSRQEYLNKINVFPVPDGDTGTNMAFTLTAILDGTREQIHSDVDQMLTTVADSALDGARGNSGVILAQFFQGLSDGAAEVKKMDTNAFSNAILYGAKYAREALSEPKEGTILSVLTDFSQHLIKLINLGHTDFASLLEKGLEKAEESLANTMNQLEVLRKAGVVDAGAQGFVDLLEGILDYISSGSIKKFGEITFSSYPSVKIQSAGEEVDLEYKYCTECMIIGDDIDRKTLRKRLMYLGNSLVFAGSKQKAKVHIHVNNPAEVFKTCEEFGNVINQKADDMEMQQKISHDELTNVAILTDSGADFLDISDLDIHMVPLRYNFGNVGFIDKISLNPIEFYEKLSTSSHHPQTSQPTPGDIRRQYQYISTHYKSIISIHLPHALSGTWQSAVNAAKRLPDTNISVVDSKTASLAQGLIVSVAAEAAQNGKSHEEILQIIDECKENTELFAIIPNLSYAVRGGRVKSSKKRIADLFNITPILTIEKTGNIKTASYTFGKKHIVDKLTSFAIKKMDPNKSYRILIGHADSKSRGNNAMSKMKEKFKSIHSIHLIDLGLALGVHGGPGTIAIAFMEQ